MLDSDHRIGNAQQIPFLYQSILTDKFQSDITNRWVPEYIHKIRYFQKVVYQSDYVNVAYGNRYVLVERLNRDARDLNEAK
jgi:hypothetical protein